MRNRRRPSSRSPSAADRAPRPQLPPPNPRIVRRRSPTAARQALQVVCAVVGGVLLLVGAVPFTWRAWQAFVTLVGGPVYRELALIVVGAAVLTVGLVGIDDGRRR